MGGMYLSLVDRLPADLGQKRQWLARKEVDERDPDAKEGASSCSSIFNFPTR